MLCKTLIQKTERGDFRNFLDMRVDRAVRGERVAQTKLSEAEYQREVS